MRRRRGKWYVTWGHSSWATGVIVVSFSWCRGGVTFGSSSSGSSSAFLCMGHLAYLGRPFRVYVDRWWIYCSPTSRFYMFISRWSRKKKKKKKKKRRRRRRRLPWWVQFLSVLHLLHLLLLHGTRFTRSGVVGCILLVAFDVCGISGIWKAAQLVAFIWFDCGFLFIFNGWLFGNFVLERWPKLQFGGFQHS